MGLVQGIKYFVFKRHPDYRPAILKDQKNGVDSCVLVKEQIPSRPPQILEGTLPYSSHGDTAFGVPSSEITTDYEL